MSFAAILTLTTFILAAFVFSLLPFAGERKQATVYLSALLGLICLVAGTRFSILADSDWMLYLHYVTLPLAYIHGPVVFLYIYTSLFREPWRRVLGRYWWAALPVLIALVVHIITVASVTERWGKEAIRSGQGLIRDYLGVHFTIGFIYTQVFMYLAFKKLTVYRRGFEEQYSTEAVEQLRWLRLFLIVCTVWFCAPLVLVPLMYLLPGRVSFADSPITIVPLAVIIYMIMQHALVRPRALSRNEGNTEQASRLSGARYEKANLDEKKRLAIAEKIRDAMREDQLYLEPELSIPRLARELGVPAHQLSMVINLEFETNFNGLVSAYRVQEAAMLLRDPDLKEETVLNIGFRAGFNSKAALNRMFKRITGYTPREFRGDDSIEWSKKLPGDSLST